MRSYFPDFALLAYFILKLSFLYGNHTDFIKCCPYITWWTDPIKESSKE